MSDAGHEKGRDKSEETRQEENHHEMREDGDVKACEVEEKIERQEREKERRDRSETERRKKER